MTQLSALDDKRSAGECFAWQKLHGAALFKAAMKQSPEDFVVEEILGFELSGQGEHHFLWVEKENTNTAFVAEQLSKFSKIPLRDIGYAGRKDKFARTLQYFSIYQGKHDAPDWTGFEQQDIRILESTRHDKKLRTGALEGNRFKLRFHHISDFDETAFAQRIKAIEDKGVPNYYGQQRFGEMHTREGIVRNGNLHLGLRMASGEVIKNRNKRSMAISALRSFLFNEQVSHRVQKQYHMKVLKGDALQLSGSNSYFIADESQDFARLQARLHERDILTSAALAGKGEVKSEADAREFEQALLNTYPEVLKCLGDAGLKQERRSNLLYPKDIKWHFESSCLSLSFSLPSGAFATSVVRELMDCD